jgi:spore coat polysaccharide biosynthesis predicted glycosyltransferase SpsG
MGHIVRGMSLADAVAGSGVGFVFVTRDAHGVPDLLRKKGHTVWAVDPELESTGIAEVVRSLDPSVVVNDIQNAPVEYVKRLKGCGAALVSFDECGEAARFTDVLIDANVAEDTLYVSHGGPRRYYGPRYMLLGSDFAVMHGEKKVIREKVENVLVIMGGSDPQNLTEKVVLALDGLAPEFAVNAVAGYGFTKREILQEMSQRREWLTVVESPASMWQLMWDADAAFSSGGISMFELASVGTPGIVLCQAGHEVDNAEAFVARGIVESLGVGDYVSADEIVRCFSAVAGNAAVRRTMSVAGRDFIDGKGVERISRILDECMMQYSS